MGGQGVSTELTATMWAATQSLGTIFGTMDGHAAAHDARPTFGLTVDRFRAARSSMLLEPEPVELHVAKLADGTTQNAGEGQMIGHHDPGDLRATLVGTGNRIVLAGVQMGL